MTRRPLLLGFSPSTFNEAVYPYHTEKRSLKGLVLLEETNSPCNMIAIMSTRRSLLWRRDEPLISSLQLLWMAGL